MIGALVQNGRLMSLLIALLIVAGSGALFTLPVAEDPTMVSRHAMVLTSFPGARAERVEALVTAKLELKLRELPEIDEINSQSGNGMSSISIGLASEVTDTEPLWSEVRDLISEVQSELPQGALPSRFLGDRGYAYTLLVALRPAPGHQLQRPILQRFARELQSVVRTYPGTELVEIDGEVVEEILVEVDTAKAAAAGQTAITIAESLRQFDTKGAAGLLENSRGRLQVEITGDLDSIERVARVPISSPGQAQVLRVGDIASVSRVVRTPDTEKSLRLGTEQVIVSVRMHPDQRIGSWQKGVMAELAVFETALPGNVEMEVIFDQLTYTEQRMSHLTSNIAIGFVLITLILLVTLGWRSALLVSAALPLMCLFTFFVMRLMDVPINQMSVTGLVVALGITVDNAIVMVDDIAQRRRQGLASLEAVQGAVGHLWLPLFGSTATTILAFLPIVLQAGAGGEFVGPLAACVIFALAGSYLLSHTLVAALAGKVISGQPRGGWWRDGVEIPALAHRFDTSLRFALANPRKVILLVLVLPVLGFYGIRGVPEQFFPPVDRDMFTVEVALPTRASFAATENLVRKIDKVMLEQEGLESVDWFIGKSAAPFYYNLIERRFNTQNYAQAMVKARDYLYTERLVSALEKILPERFPEAHIKVKKLEQGPPVENPLELRLYGPDLAVLEGLGNQMRLLLSELPDIVSTTASLGDTMPSVRVSLREEILSGAGTPPAAFSSDIRASLDGLLAGSILEATEEVPVRVRLSQVQRSTSNDLKSLNVMFGQEQGNTTSLQAIADFDMAPSLVSIPHFNGRRVNTIGASPRNGVLADTVQKNFLRLLQERNVELPSGYTMELAGEMAERGESIGHLASSIPLIVVLLIVVLVLSFDSWRLCALILFTAALSVGLGMLSLVFSGYAFGFQVIIALLGLMGLAINGAIVILAEMRSSPAALAGEADAIVASVMHCTRHISSTTITTIAGFMPLLVGGGLFWPPFAATIVGGTAMVTVLSFYLVPCAFLL
ncbi:MAG: multidrug efflux pump, partial [Bacteroidia bacterium]